jgi:hypothetical protein
MNEVFLKLEQMNVIFRNYRVMCNVTIHTFVSMSVSYFITKLSFMHSPNIECTVCQRLF